MDINKETTVKRKPKLGESLAEKYPELAVEWHPFKNEDLTPYDVSPKSHLKVWWLGKCGHEWNATIASRTNGAGCPFDSGKKVLVGVNDFQTTYPELAKEWHPLKNGELKASDVRSKSNRKVFWSCSKCGTEWVSTVSQRTAGKKCPICEQNKQVSVNKKEKSIASLYPDLLDEWDYDKNKSLNPDMILSGSEKKVWWKCHLYGHEWQATVRSRTRGTGCPVCSNKKVMSGFNDLSTICPKVVKEWHPTKNLPLTPESVTKSSAKKVWWRCSVCNNEWEAPVYSRTSRGQNGCPKCKVENSKINSRKPKAGNSLLERQPELTLEWHPTKNGVLKPADVAFKSHSKVWWRCKYCGFEWEAVVSSRTKGAGCPACAKVKRNGHMFK